MALGKPPFWRPLIHHLRLVASLFSDHLTAAGHAALSRVLSGLLGGPKPDGGPESPSGG